LNLPLGYAYSAVYAGIRQAERDDLALIVTGLDASAAAVFTRNRVQAAPVGLCRRHLALSKGRVGAILMNAGNANCARARATPWRSTPRAPPPKFSSCRWRRCSPHPPA